MKFNKDKLRYAILSEISKGREGKGPHAESFGVSEDDFFDQVTFLHREGYMNKPLYADDSIYGWPLSGITEKGEKYLKQNSGWQKAYVVMKEIRDWIKI